ncbi:unnamed protein product [Auanema sp. JU1783]|nr:unnamed protein product [Auanema sp. JU1783]
MSSAQNNKEGTSTKINQISVIFQDGLPFECTCPVCQQALRSPIKASCGHYYCKDCLQGFLRQIIISENLRYSVWLSARYVHLRSINHKYWSTKKNIGR